MPNTNWGALNSLQLGRYAEYFAKMEFASYGLEVFSSEVDDRGIDFIVKDKTGRFIEIQVKSLRGTGYVFAQKSKFNIQNSNLYLALVIFMDGQMPDFFLLPAEVWKAPNEVFVDRNYDKPGQKSKPEYGINISNRNYDILEIFKFEESIKDFC
ncbi:DUF4365 domain-containing protein [Paenibacillus urinalis]|uniref:DUF4365 domain-containing protein n=1 Tax=Paenibacillus urinalis TaxID=521520 RepID=A0ABY7X9Y2_9BACL|nr:DUF4365 domain-containing protein [Paenibacillus urinalis]WDH98705.1 DUF4365 domain-containing protein [Paenibacillus urinalis]WDI02398.1 DUF4365 domain-containing protein [Paenibacillus urinalis]